MADKARVWTDKELDKMERDISKIYSQAEKELTEKWNAYMERGEKRLSSLQNDYMQALASQDNTIITESQKRLQDAKRAYTLQNEQYQTMVKSVTKDMAQVNQQALSYISGKLPEIYAENYEQVKDVISDIGMPFDIVDKSTVMNMIKEGDVKLPKKKVKIPKDMAWNTKKINSSVLQGIIQGESMQKIAKRLLPIVNSNKKAAIRNARTIVTGVENRGRLDSYKKLEEQGVILKKVWLATGDGRTRDWHIDMDGQEVDLKESFIDGLGNELEYPGDPGGSPETVYNCRCSMITDIVGFKMPDGSISYVEHYDEEPSLHDEEISREVQRRKEAEQPQYRVVNGADISGTWERRSDKFDFEIEDIINAQGFDGLPKVVSKDEFDKLVKQANDGNGFIAQRTYSAPDQATLDMYRDQLYNGKFYVDCSTGGAQYGQGMYCAANYNGELSEGIKSEMTHYMRLNGDRMGGVVASDETKNDIIQKFINNLNADAETKHASEIYLKWQTGLRDGIDRSELSSVGKILGHDGMNSLKNKVDIVQNSYEGCRTYVETFTLDQSARIIKYDDLFREFNDYKANVGEISMRGFIDGLQENETFKTALSGNLQLTDFDSGYKAYSKLSDIEKERLQETMANARKFAKEKELEATTMNIGSFATSKGYDAINAVGHGDSNSYTVVLNRTKLIILGE